MTSNAKTVEDYLEGLPEERRAALSAVRKVILANLPAGYQVHAVRDDRLWQLPLQI